jgi:outer membrane protein
MTITKLSVAAACLLAAGAACAQRAGTITVEAGITNLTPKVTSGDLSAPAFPNSKSDVKGDTQITGAVNYSVTDDLVLSVPLGLGFKHDIVGAGRIEALGKIGEVKALPITALLQYRFLGAQASFRPYIGAGVTYAKFYGTKGTAALTALTAPGSAGTTLAVDSKVAGSLQLGAVFNVNDKIYVNGNMIKTFLSTRTNLSTGQSIDAKLDPLALSLAVGTKF